MRIQDIINFTDLTKSALYFDGMRGRDLERFFQDNPQLSVIFRSPTKNIRKTTPCAFVVSVIERVPGETPKIDSYIWEYRGFDEGMDKFPGIEPEHVFQRSQYEVLQESDHMPNTRVGFYHIENVEGRNLSRRLGATLFEALQYLDNKRFTNDVVRSYFVAEFGRLITEKGIETAISTAIEKAPHDFRLFLRDGINFYLTPTSEQAESTQGFLLSYKDIIYALESFPETSGEFRKVNKILLRLKVDQLSQSASEGLIPTRDNFIEVLELAVAAQDQEATDYYFHILCGKEMPDQYEYKKIKGDSKILVAISDFIEQENMLDGDPEKIPLQESILGLAIEINYQPLIDEYYSKLRLNHLVDQPPERNVAGSCERLIIDARELREARLNNISLLEQTKALEDRISQLEKQLAKKEKKKGKPKAKKTPTTKSGKSTKGKEAGFFEAKPKKPRTKKDKKAKPAQTKTATKGR